MKYDGTYNRNKYSNTTTNTNTWYYYVLTGLITMNTSLITHHMIVDCEKEDLMNSIDYEKDQSIMNWSGNHTCIPPRIYEPKSAQEVLRLLQYTQQYNEQYPTQCMKLRPIGTGLSPNGIGMHSHVYKKNTSSSQQEQQLVSTHALDYIEVDIEKQLVTVGAGTTVNNLLNTLNKYNLTLQNFSSITEQTLAGWTQVAAHGAGIQFSTVDDMIVRMIIATPTEGLLTLSNELNPELFHIAKVGLGNIGIVTELTLKCIPKLSLREYIYTFPNMKEMKKEHCQRLSMYRHVKYLLFPYTSSIVTIAAHPPDSIPLSQDVLYQQIHAYKNRKAKQTEKTLNGSGGRTQQPIDPVANYQSLSTYSLLRTLYQTDHSHFLTKPDTSKPSTVPTAIPTEVPNTSTTSNTTPTVVSSSATYLRDLILSYAPININLLKALHHAEVNYWEAMTDCEKVADSNDILGFDCGGHQLVYEICFPVGTIEELQNQEKDIHFLTKLMTLIHHNFIPAHCPIEVRYTAANTSSRLSPAYSTNPKDIFCWVGIIMYLPTPRPSSTPNTIDSSSKTPSSKTESSSEHSPEHQEIMDLFSKYRRKIIPLLEEYHAIGHWAKIEFPVSNNTTQQDENNRQEGGGEKKESSDWWSKITSSLSFGSQSSSSKDEEKTELAYLHRALAERYPMELYRSYRKVLDPTGILSNDFLDKLMHSTPSSSQKESPKSVDHSSNSEKK